MMLEECLIIKASEGYSQIKAEAAAGDDWLSSNNSTIDFDSERKLFIAIARWGVLYTLSHS